MAAQELNWNNKDCKIHAAFQLDLSVLFSIVENKDSTICLLYLAKLVIGTRFQGANTEDTRRFCSQLLIGCPLP